MVVLVVRVCVGGDGAAAADGAGGGSSPAGGLGAGEEGPRVGAEDRSERVGAHPRGDGQRRESAQVGDIITQSKEEVYGSVA